MMGTAFFRIFLNFYIIFIQVLYFGGFKHGAVSIAAYAGVVFLIVWIASIKNRINLRKGIYHGRRN